MFFLKHFCLVVADGSAFTKSFYDVDILLVITVLTFVVSIHYFTLQPSQVPEIQNDMLQNSREKIE